MYPAAILSRWGLTSRGYKRAVDAEARAQLIDDISRVLPWLDWTDHRMLCAESDDALDAVIAALMAREVVIGNVIRPSEDELMRARTEGWICLPAGPPSMPPG